MRRAGMSMAASWSTARDRETDRARNGLVKALETTAVAVPLFWTVRSISHGGEYETTWPNEWRELMELISLCRCHTLNFSFRL